MRCRRRVASGGLQQTESHAGLPTEQGKSMARMLAAVQTLRVYVQGNTDRLQAEQASTELVAWSGRMGELFPPGVRRQLRRSDTGDDPCRRGRDARDLARPPNGGEDGEPSSSGGAACPDRTRRVRRLPSSTVLVGKERCTRPKRRFAARLSGGFGACCADRVHLRR